MNYRCLTCGFAQDFAPTAENVAAHHPWMVGKPVNQCPSCTAYVEKYGGRKNGKTVMPDISVPGTVVDESTVQAEFDEIHSDFCRISCQEDAQLASKYAGKKLFGFSYDDIRANAQVE